jgi:hypothetical protein
LPADGVVPELILVAFDTIAPLLSRVDENAPGPVKLGVKVAILVPEIVPPLKLELTAHKLNRIVPVVLNELLLNVMPYPIVIELSNVDAAEVKPLKDDVPARARPKVAVPP